MKIFKAFYQPLNWSEASKKCQDECKYDGFLAMPDTVTLNLFLSSHLPLRNGWFWVGGYKNVSVLNALEDGWAVEYKDKAYTFKTYFPWFYSDGRRIFLETDEAFGCLLPERYPLVDCEFMVINYFATGTDRLSYKCCNIFPELIFDIYLDIT